MLSWKKILHAVNLSLQELGLPLQEMCLQRRKREGNREKAAPMKDKSFLFRVAASKTFKPRN
jgi:hypothetical protein